MDPVTDQNGTSTPEPGTLAGKLDRRRLLKTGAAAGPLVLTLRGNGGWVGSGTRCNIDRKTGKTIKEKNLSAACLASLGIKGGDDEKKKSSGGGYDDEWWG